MYGRVLDGFDAFPLRGSDKRGTFRNSVSVLRSRYPSNVTRRLSGFYTNAGALGWSFANGGTEPRRDVWTYIVTRVKKTISNRSRPPFDTFWPVGLNRFDGRRNKVTEMRRKRRPMPRGRCRSDHSDQKSDQAAG